MILGVQQQTHSPRPVPAGQRCGVEQAEETSPVEARTEHRTPLRLPARGVPRGSVIAVDVDERELGLGCARRVQAHPERHLERVPDTSQDDVVDEVGEVVPDTFPRHAATLQWQRQVVRQATVELTPERQDGQPALLETGCAPQTVKVAPAS